MAQLDPDQSPEVSLYETEIERLRQENARLRQSNRGAFQYIRDKVDALLEVIGTKTLKPEELDDQSLIDFDPIGIVTQSFLHVLNNLRATNRQLQFVHEEIQTIFDTVGAALLVLDPGRRILAYNQKTRDLLLDREHDIHGCDCREAVCKLQGQNPRCIFERVVTSGREQQFQDWRHKDRTYNVIGRPMYGENGDITHVVLAYTDITARRNAEAALLEALTETQEANAKIHGILRAATDGMLITDAEGHIVLLNRRAEELFNFCLTDLQSMPRLDILPHRELVSLIEQAPLSGKDALSEDLVFVGPGGKDRIHQARITVISSASGAFRGCITFLQDVTEQRDVDRMKSEFVSTAAHELRTPLATIIGYTDLLLTGDDQVRESLHDYLKLIQDKAERLADIVGDLLDISRIESGEALQLNPGPCRLDTLCREVLNGFRNQRTAHVFRLDLPEDLPVEVHADRYALLQILENVLSNAVKYSPDGGEISLVAQREKDCCRLSIRDHGIGMTPDQLERVFDKFYRADATNTAISGTGLGMTIVRYLVEAQAGDIQVESLPNQGTTVHIRLPLDASARPGLH